MYVNVVTAPWSSGACVYSLYTCTVAHVYCLVSMVQSMHTCRIPAQLEAKLELLVCVNSSVKF